MRTKGLLVILCGMLMVAVAWAEDFDLPRQLIADGFTETKLLRRFEDTRVSVAVQINGKELKLIVDTGAPYTLLSRKAAERCGIQIEKVVGPTRGSNGVADENAGLARVEHFSINGVELTATPVAISNFEFPYLFGNDFDGLLGLATMKANNVILGYNPHFFCFNPMRLPSHKLSEWLTAAGYSAIEPKLERGRYLLPLGVDGVEARTMLDTGAQGTVVSLDFAEKHRIPFGRDRIYSSGMDGKGAIGRTLLPRRLSIGMLLVPAVPLAAVKMEIFRQEQVTSQGAPEALLAFDVLKPYAPVLDMAGDRLYLRLPAPINLP